MSKLINITEAQEEEKALELEFVESLKAGFPSPAADLCVESSNRKSI